MIEDRCPNCGHPVRAHHEDGCWQTVERSAACPCSDPWGES